MTEAHGLDEADGVELDDLYVSQLEPEDHADDGAELDPGELGEGPS